MKKFTPSATLFVFLYFAGTINALACSCAGQDYKDFWKIISPTTQNAMVRFKEVVQGGQNGYDFGKFDVLENYNHTGFNVNDVITLFSVDNTCGANIQEMTAGDTLIIALSSNLFLDASCTKNFIGVWNGKSSGQTMDEIKARIMTLTSSPEDIRAQSDFMVYPNPAISNLTVKFTHAGKLPNKIEILDMSGRVMKTKETPSVEENLEIQSLPSGLYILKLCYIGLRPIMRRWVKI
ncbi:MAG: T9SS type A sorting domain-containing protein [Rufibacter sp.]